MNIVKDDIWNFREKEYCVVITTNGCIKEDGKAVMGRGIAGQAKKLFKGLDSALGTLLKKHGNEVFFFERQKLITLPTKTNWKSKSDLQLISRSCQKLAKLLKSNENIKVAMPKPGCGNGGRTWEEVAPIVYKHLNEYSNRIVIVDNDQGDTDDYYGKNKENMNKEKERNQKPLVIEEDKTGKVRKLNFEQLSKQEEVDKWKKKKGIESDI